MTQQYDWDNTEEWLRHPRDYLFNADYCSTYPVFQEFRRITTVGEMFPNEEYD